VGRRAETLAARVGVGRNFPQPVQLPGEMGGAGQEVDGSGGAERLSGVSIVEERTPEIRTDTVVVEMGGVAIHLRTSSSRFAQMVEDRYAGFASRQGASCRWNEMEFEVELLAAAETADSLHDDDLEQDDDLEVTCEGGVWHMVRGDFSAEWDAVSGRGRIRQSANPYSLDSVLRIVHSLVLAKRGEFLVHAASAVRNGRAFLFAGVSGAGKTTISRLAPPDATLLTDEISYVRRSGSDYEAHGTPFAGELGRVGARCSAPLQALYLLRQGPENRLDEVAPGLAVQALMRNILFFAHDAELVHRVFEGACEFVDRVPVRTLTFRPEAAVWNLIV
jgi:hypothetical protein